METKVRPPSPADELLQTYLNDVGKAPLLTAEEERELSEKIRAGLEVASEVSGLNNKQIMLGMFRKSDDFKQAELTPGQKISLEEAFVAEDVFVKSNLRLVVSIAKKYGPNTGQDLLDLVQEGNVGLVKAVHKYDGRKGFKFSTYATWWINQAIQRSIADKGSTIRIPVHMRDQIRQRGAVIQDLIASNREPTNEAIAHRIGSPLKRAEDIERVATYILGVASLDKPVSSKDDNTVTVGDLVESNAAISNPEALTIDRIHNSDLRKALDEFDRDFATDQRFADIIKYRYGFNDGEPQTLDTIGRKYNLTRERIRQLERHALAQFKDFLTRKAAQHDFDVLEDWVR